MAAAVDTLGHRLAWRVTAASEPDRAQVEPVADQVQHATGQSLELALVDQGDTGAPAAHDAAAHSSRLEVVTRPQAKHGCVLLPRRWVVERSVAGATRLRRRVREYERWPETVAGLHFLAFAIRMLRRFVEVMAYLL